MIIERRPIRVTFSTFTFINFFWGDFSPIFVVLLVALSLGLSVKVIACLLIVFLVYLIVAILTSIKYIDVYVLLKFVPLIGVLVYFIVKGLNLIQKHTNE